MKCARHVFWWGALGGVENTLGIPIVPGLGLVPFMRHRTLGQRIPESFGGNDKYRS